MNNLSSIERFICPESGAVITVSQSSRAGFVIVTKSTGAVAEFATGIYHQVLAKAGFVQESHLEQINAYEEQEANRYALTPH